MVAFCPTVEGAAPHVTMSNSKLFVYNAVSSRLSTPVITGVLCLRRAASRGLETPQRSFQFRTSATRTPAETKPWLYTRHITPISWH